MYVYRYEISVSAALACLHACVSECVRVSVNLGRCQFVSVCLGCRCFVSLMRGVQGPPRGPVEDNLLPFCYESSSARNRRNSLKWRRGLVE